MNDEPHSHKKATVAVVAVLLLAYVGSYLWFRQRSGAWAGVRIRGFRLLVAPKLHSSYPATTFVNRLYWPLRQLDRRITGVSVSFYDNLAPILKLRPPEQQNPFSPSPNDASKPPANPHP